MVSDNNCDGFAYNSSQDSLQIEYQIDLFEIRQYAKFKRQYKGKASISLYPFSMRTRRSPHPLIKIYGMNDKRTPKTEQKLSRYIRYPEKRKKEKTLEGFECDRQYPIKSEDDLPNFSLTVKSLHDFSDFRRHFYYANHQKMKASLQDQPDIEIIDIRIAPIGKSVQNGFMQKLNENTKYFPHLVYHGTQLNNIRSILRYGFLIPNQRHPTNRRAPIIATKNGSAYGSGIYSSETASYSLSYLNNTNTLLACAAVPKRDDAGKVERSHGNILVLSHVSEIMPLFLIDFRYANGSGMNQPWFGNCYNKYMVTKEDPNKPFTIAKKHLRKVLNCMNDDVQRSKRYRRRKNNRRKVRRYEEYSVRVFEP